MGVTHQQRWERVAKKGALMKNLPAFWVLVTCLRLAAAQCPLITVSEVEDALNVQLGQQGGEGGSDLVQVTDFNINCLAAASTRGYAQTTVTANYSSPGNPEDSLVAQLNINCFGTAWDEEDDGNRIITPEDSDFGGGTATAEELLAAEVDISCLRCHVEAQPNSPSHCRRKYAL